MIVPLLSVAAILATAVNAHFLLQHPVGIGFIDSDESDGPCGSFLPNFNNDTITDWHTDGDFISTSLAHPESNWLYRATLDKTAMGGWVPLFPISQQSGLGDFCQPSVPAPVSWVGQQGVLGIVADGPDGILYQCALVNFVNGTGSPNTTTCTNATGVSASFVPDPSLSALVNSTSSSNSSSSTTSGSPAASSSKSVASGYTGQGPSALGSLVVVGIMAMVGTAIL